MYDYTSHIEEDRDGSNAVAALRALAVQQHEAEMAVAMAELALQEAKENLRVISEQKLPEMMEELGIPYFETKDGLKIEVRETVHVYMGRSSEEKSAALDWLEDNGHGHIIKRTVEVPFAKGQDEDARRLAEDLISEGRRATFARKVEPMTLKAFVTERLESGEDIPLELFKVHRPKSSKVSLG